MLKVTGLRKSFASEHGTVHAVNGIDFEIPPGGFFTILGPSGCGKTTTLRCVAGLERPTGGSISIGGRVVADAEQGLHLPAFKRDIGMVFQSYAIWPHMDVFRNVAYPLQVARPRVRRAEVEAKVMDALRLVGMEAMARRPATDLSGGQQQRVAFARAIVRQPKLLLLDEPLSNLDSKLREQMRAELQELVARVAITTLYVTHDQAEALAMSDHVAVMSDGVIAQCGPPPLVYSQPATRFVATFLGTANLLRARIVARNGSSATVVLDSGTETVQLEVPAALGAGDWIDVVFRPEDTALSFASGNGNALKGTLERISFQGGVSECHIRVGSAVVRSNLHPSITARRGDQVWVSLDPKRCVVFGA
jgi:ABC-type Fe3+/spermidine/putrescine transport system ATPase subunit